VTDLEAEPAGPAAGGPALRLLHVSDLHLAEPQDAEHVSALAALAAQRAAGVLLIVGDFFDHGRVSAATLDAAGRALRQVPARVVILPGNHDPFMPGSAYLRADLGGNVHVLSAPGGETYEIPELDLAIWGRPHCGYDDFRPLAGIPPRGAATWQVAMAHGHLTRGPGDLGRAYPISPAEIAGSGRDYVALGHWDMPDDASSGPVIAAYSGSPSRLRTCTLTTLRLDRHGRRHVAVERVAVPGPLSPAGPGR
jgi:DNA repair exonuclease SbcCD nuclease subunit